MDKFIPVHHHLMVSADVNCPPRSPDRIKKFLREVVNKAGMTIISGPHAEHVAEPGNEGSTGVCILAESHCAIHVWDAEIPARIEFDLYSCAKYDVDSILYLLNQFDPVSMKWKFLDRDVDDEWDCIENNIMPEVWS